MKERLLAELQALEPRRATESPAWLAPLRRAATERFAALGLPTTRDEDWRYTNLAPLAAVPVRLAGEATPESLSERSLERFVLAGAEWPRLVFVDGRYAAKLSSPRPLAGGARAVSLAEAMITDGELVERHLARHAKGEANAFAALSTACFQDGAFVHWPAEAQDATPIELWFVATTAGVLSHPRTLIVAGPHSRGAVVERHIGLAPGAYVVNVVTEIVAARGAAVEHYVLQEQASEGFHLATRHVALERDGAFASHEAILGGRLARTTLTLAFGGEGARGTLGGLYVVRGRQHVDNHVTVDHAVPRCSSQQLYKGVLDDQARAVFNGRIVVRRDAQKTDASQINKHLLLSDGVEVDSKPQLEIFADDVKCTHGAAEGQLAPEALFYLRSRGLGEDAARALLTYGFAREVIERIALPPVRAYLDRALLARLAPGRAPKEMP